MPEKRGAPTRRTAAKKTAAKKTAVRKPAVVHKTLAAPKPLATTAPPPEPRMPGPATVQVCPRCGTEKFAPEQRTRAEGTRTVRYTVLVCERGHTFARPRSR